MSWRDDAKKDFAGKYVKFDVDNPEHVVTFLEEPTKRMMQSTFKKGETYPSYDFPVELDGSQKIMSVTQRGLMDLILEEDEDESILGRSFRIKMIGEGKNKQWRIKEVPGQRQIHQSFEKPANTMPTGAPVEAKARSSKQKVESPQEEEESPVVKPRKTRKPKVKWTEEDEKRDEENSLIIGMGGDEDEQANQEEQEES